MIALQRREQRVEPIVGLVPVLPVAGQPRGRLPQRLRLEVAEVVREAPLTMHTSAATPISAGLVRMPVRSATM